MKISIDSLKHYLMLGAIAGIAAIAVGYVISNWDFIPDNIPLFGHLDDVLVVIGAFTATLAISRFKTKIFTGKHEKSTWTYLFSWPALVALALTAIGLAYVFSGIQIIPNATPVVGYLDDTIVIIGMFLAWLKVLQLFQKRRKAK